MSHPKERFVLTLWSVTGCNFWLNNSVLLHLLQGSDNKFQDLFLFCTFHTCCKTLLYVICCKPGLSQACLGAKCEQGQASHSHCTPRKSTENNYHKLRSIVQTIFFCKHLEQSIPWSMDISKQEGQCTYNVILRYVRVTIFDVEKKQV